MPTPVKIKKIVVKIPRHPYIRPQADLERVTMRKCRVNLERMKSQQFPEFSVNSKQKRCCVRVARLPNVARSELSVTPASSVVYSDFSDGESSD
ncbi:uncharacterized protein LOC108599915 [Drosophila busckii]|uniref:uncharacterized protein LOC108599915 n=1 Tax=Drosophila busckii TaxID=30019 RepID=UPI00083EE75D|nr:uncharacterized protein LOC108599915 [Drosophila busckii]